MKSRFRPKLSYSNVIATIALFAALGGAAVAAGLPKHSVGAKQLKRGAVTPAALRKGAVTSPKLAQKSVIVGKLGPSAVLPGNIVDGAITSDKLATNSVIAAKIKNGVITANKLDNEAVTTAKLGKGSVTLAKLADEVTPLLGTLRTGQTLRGTFDLGGETKVARDGISFQFPLANAPTAPDANILAPGASTTACPGVKGGSAQTPEAAAGQLCVYIKTEAGAPTKSLSFDAGSINRLGFGLTATFNEAKPENAFQGFWAVTAP
jgi:hypothetical protein